MFLQLSSLEALKLGFFIPWIRIWDPPNFDGSGSLAEKLADPDPKHCPDEKKLIQINKIIWILIINFFTDPIMGWKMKMVP